MDTETRLISLAENVMNAITEAMLDLGHGTGDARYEDAEDAAFDCVIAIVEMDIGEFEVTDDFRRRLKEAIHNIQITLTSMHDAEEKP